MTRGLVIGKFFPPHRGHKHLIDTAAAQVDELTVVVCDHPDQDIPGELRAAWLRELHPAARVMVVPDTVPSDDSRGWAAYTKRFLGSSPDVVFTSEAYGPVYASHLGARHVSVDPERRAVPVRARDVRAAPLAHWDRLEPCVRAHFARRVAVLGAESTGTTTLARGLAEHFKTAWVPEIGRLYTEAKVRAPGGNLWRTEEFVFIAREQNRLEDALARTCDRLLFCDTDSFATSLWHERYLGTLSPAVDAESAGRRWALTILTDADIPFVQDGLRDGEHIRHGMHARFREELERRGRPYLLVSGPPERRMTAAVSACDALLRRP